MSKISKNNRKRKVFVDLFAVVSKNIRYVSILLKIICCKDKVQNMPIDGSLDFWVMSNCYFFIIFYIWLVDFESLDLNFNLNSWKSCWAVQTELRSGGEGFKFELMNTVQFARLNQMIQIRGTKFKFMFNLLKLFNEIQKVTLKNIFFVNPKSIFFNFIRHNADLKK